MHNDLIVICLSVLLSIILCPLVIAKEVYDTRTSDESFSSANCFFMCLLCFIPMINVLIVLIAFFHAVCFVCSKIDPHINRLIKGETKLEDGE